MTKGRRFFTDELQAVKLPRLGGSCALCVDGLGCGGEQSGYCPRGGNMQRFSFLPGCRVLQIERGSRGSRVILADNRRGSARCPPCGAVSRAVHSRYRRSPADLPDFGHELRVALLVRRFYCRQATCPKRTFAERFAGAVAPYARRAGGWPRHWAGPGSLLVALRARGSPAGFGCQSAGTPCDASSGDCPCRPLRRRRTEGLAHRG
ncbi:hypothetical protein GAY28_01635 [Azospirillum brasilense]|nr:hypothetical protein [Azospirillum brasilense]